jgi:hypothetical protein
MLFIFANLSLNEYQGHHFHQVLVVKIQIVLSAEIKVKSKYGMSE